MYRILIASGDEVLRKTLAFSLHDLNVKVESVASKSEMLAVCRTVEYDLVLLVGTMLPICRQDVMDVLRPEGRRSPRIFVVSWQHSERMVLRAHQVGVNQYMTIPVNLHLLRSKIQNEMELWTS